MSKKIGIIFAVFAGLLILCCLGGFFYLKGIANRITDVVKKDQAYVTLALNSTASTWDEKEFAPYADASFNTPQKRAETQKLFGTLKQKLGRLIKLGGVVPDTKTFRANSDGTGQGFFVTLTAKATFEKGTGVFTVTVKNVKDQVKIYNISLDPERPSNSSHKP